MNTAFADHTNEPVRSLAAHYYTDANIFANEQNGLFTRTWQFAGHTSQLKQPGDFFTATIAKQEIFCIRDRNEDIRAFYNVCQHRAHTLVNGKGNCKVIVCPYHAWTYELDGRLRSGPNLKAIKNIDTNQIRLSEIRVEIFCGFVFVNLDPEARPMADWFPDVEQELRNFVPGIDQLEPLEWVTVSEKCNWKVSVENYSECYHCQLNHKTFSTGVIRPSTYDIQPQGHCLRHTTECQNLDKMSYPIDLQSSKHAGDYSSWFLWPTFSFQVYPGNVLNTYHWHPTAVDEVTMVRGWYTTGGQESGIVRELAIQDRQTTVEEDITLVEAVQRGLNSRGYKPGPLVLDPNCGVNSEHSVQVLQQWMREAVDD